MSAPSEEPEQRPAWLRYMSSLGLQSATATSSSAAAARLGAEGAPTSPARPTPRSANRFSTRAASERIRQRRESRRDSPYERAPSDEDRRLAVRRARPVSVDECAALLGFSSVSKGDV